MNSNYSITNAPLTNLSEPNSRNYHCPRANIPAAIPPTIFTLLFIPHPLRRVKESANGRSGARNAINKAGKQQPFKSPLFCYCAVAIASCGGQRRSQIFLPSSYRVPPSPCGDSASFLLLSSPLAFSSSSCTWPCEGWFPRRNGGKEKRKKKEAKGCEEGVERGTEREKESRIFYIKCHDSATLTGETMWRCYCPTLRYQTKWRGGGKKWKGRKKEWEREKRETVYGGLPRVRRKFEKIVGT